MAQSKGSRKIESILEKSFILAKLYFLRKNGDVSFSIFKKNFASCELVFLFKYTLDLLGNASLEVALGNYFKFK